MAILDDFDIDHIDEVIHGRLRLGVMALLSGRNWPTSVTSRPG